MLLFKLIFQKVDSTVELMKQYRLRVTVHLTVIEDAQSVFPLFT